MPKTAIADPRAPAMSRSVTSANDAASALLVAQQRVLLDSFEEPIAERRLGLDHSTAEEVQVGVGEVGRDREQTAERHRMLLEYVAGHLVASLAVAPYLYGGIERVDARELVIGVARQPVRQEVVPDTGERRNALGITDKTAVAPRYRLPSSSSPFIGMCTCPCSPGIPAAPRTIRALSMTPPPRPVPTIAEIDDRSAPITPKCSLESGTFPNQANPFQGTPVVRTAGSSVETEVCRARRVQ